MRGRREREEEKSKSCITNHRWEKIGILTNRQLLWFNDVIVRYPLSQLGKLLLVENGRYLLGLAVLHFLGNDLLKGNVTSRYLGEMGRRGRYGM